MPWWEWTNDSMYKDRTKPCELELHLYHLIAQVVAGGRSSPDCRPLNIPPGCWPLATWPHGLRGPAQEQPPDIFRYKLMLIQRREEATLATQAPVTSDLLLPAQRAVQWGSKLKG